jgi:hypothetical protein
MIQTEEYWKAIPKQTVFSSETTVGDCWRCCVAAVLGLAAEKVPHFLARAIEEKTCVDGLTQQWLNGRGLCMVEVMGGQYGGGFNWPRYFSERDDVPWPAVIMGGPTERSRGIGQHHAVVAILGRIVYDPHPSEAGLTAITHQWAILPSRERLMSLMWVQ